MGEKVEEEGIFVDIPFSYISGPYVKFSPSSLIDYRPTRRVTSRPPGTRKFSFYHKVVYGRVE